MSATVIRRNVRRMVQPRGPSSRVVLVVVAFAIAATCSPPASAQQDDVSRKVQAWMRCQECNGGQLRAVVALGSAAVPALRTILIQGPPEADIAVVQRSLNALAGSPGATPAPSAAAIARQLRNFASGYRIRAALALGEIGGAEARAALCAGRGAGATPDNVARAIEQALQRIGGSCA